jgi:hypothetical protein
MIEASLFAHSINHEEDFNLFGDGVDNLDGWGTDLEEFDVKNLGPLPPTTDLENELFPITPDIFKAEASLPSGQTTSENVIPKSFELEARSTLSGFSLLMPELERLPFASSQYSLSLKSLEQKMRKSAESRRRLHDLCKGLLGSNEFGPDQLKCTTRETSSCFETSSKPNPKKRRLASETKPSSRKKKTKSRCVSICNQRQSPLSITSLPIYRE